MLVAVGTVGYVWIEDWSIIDAFYMTIITISTVGFGEVAELSHEGRLFTAGLIVLSFGTFAFAISSITTYIIGGEYRRYYRRLKLIRMVEKMENHVIICGFGRVGRQVAFDLEARGKNFIIVEENQEIIDDFTESKGFQFLKGNAIDDHVLHLANVSKASAIITCLPSDADNIYVVLAAREYNNKMLIVSRASLVSSVNKLRRAGANNVIMPDSIGGSHMASLIINPDVMEFLDIIRVQGNMGANIESIDFNELPERFHNRTIGELSNDRTTGVTIIGFKTVDGQYLINPSYDTKVVPNSKLFVLGSNEQIALFNKTYDITH